MVEDDGGLESAREGRDEEFLVSGATELSAADFQEAWHHVPAFKRLKFYALALPSVWLLHLVVVSSSARPDAQPTDPWPLLSAIIAVCILGVIFVVMAPRGWAKAALADLGSGRVTFRFAAAAMHVTSPLREHRLTWASLPQHIETAGTFIVYTGAQTVLVVPKRAFDAEALERLRALLRKRIPTKPQAPVWRTRLLVWVVALVVFLGVWQVLSVPP